MAVTYQQTECVCISVSNDDGGIGVLPSDPDGIVNALSRFLWNNRIVPVIRGGMSSPTSHLAFYSPSDAKKIIDFLKTLKVPERG